MSKKKSKKTRALSEIIRDIQKQFSKNTVRDVAETLFVSSLWLPNVSSSVQHHLLYAAFISMHPDSFSQSDTIGRYNQFRALLRKIYSLLPSFPSMEDYIPELDWGDVKFYHEGKPYKIFYGCDIETIYDFLYSFQILYASLDESIQNITHRSPSAELKSCLQLQDKIISSIQLSKEEIVLKNIDPGYVEVPPLKFWLAATQYYNTFDSIDFLPLNVLHDYSVSLGSEEFITLVRQNDLLELISSGRLLKFFFVKHEGHYYSVFPRKFSEVLLQNWSNLFKQYSQQLMSQINYKEHLAVQLWQYLSERYHGEGLFPFASPVSTEGYPEEPVFSCAFRARDRLILIYVVQPIWNGELAQKDIEELTPKLKQAIQLLEASPTTLALHDRKERVAFKSKKDKRLDIEIITVLPSTAIEGIAIQIPEQMPGRVIFMDDFLALFDELTNFTELDSFYEFLAVNEPKMLIPFLTLTDKFGAFRDFAGIIAHGAREFNFISLDPHWGSNKRYETLKEFWTLFPSLNIDLLGHPRSWLAEKVADERVSLIARNHIGRILICEVGKTTILVNSPLDRMTYEHGRKADLMTEIVEDSLCLNSEILSQHSFFQTNRVLLISVFPANLGSVDK